MHIIFKKHTCYFWLYVLRIKIILIVKIFNRKNHLFYFINNVTLTLFQNIVFVFIESLYFNHIKANCISV